MKHEMKQRKKEESRICTQVIYLSLLSWAQVRMLRFGRLTDRGSVNGTNKLINYKLGVRRIVLFSDISNLNGTLAVAL